MGVVEHFWEKPGVVGIHLSHSSLSVGDTIAFHLLVEFEEQRVESLQIDNESITSAEKGARVAIKTHLTKDQARKGVNVFRLGS